MEDPVTTSRLVVLSKVYHQSNQQPTVVSYDYQAKLKTDEQPYHRTIPLGTTKIKLDTGWVKTASLIVIKNEPTVFRINPTPEEIQDMEARIIELWISGWPSFLIHPGRHFSACPKGLDYMEIVCQHGTTKCSISVYPE